MYKCVKRESLGITLMVAAADIQGLSFEFTAVRTANHQRHLRFSAAVACLVLD
jgi:hypothetical protein